MPMTGQAMKPGWPTQAMKNWICRRLDWGLAMGMLLLALGCVRPAASQESQTTVIPAPDTNATEAQASLEQGDELANGDEVADLAEAEATPTPAARPAPAGLKLSAPAAEVIKLAESGTEEGVLLAFVSNSSAPFNLGADEIIYMNDIGVSSEVVAAMIQRDQALGGGPASVEPAPAAPVAEEPELYAPQPAESSAVAEAPPAAPPPPAETVSYPVFYNSLSPYGTWIDVAGWGPCWRPTVVVANPGWRPYCNGGRWIYSDCGWYWLSDYTWGWAPFHYGRWFRHHRMGWCWAPDTVWGPSWVSWRHTATHCGWAPLPPGASFTYGHGLAYRGRTVSSSFSFGLGVSSFTFVETTHFHSRHLNRHVLPPTHARHVFHQAPPSTPIVMNHGRVMNHGIPPARITQATRTEIHTVTLQPTRHAPGRNTRGERLDGNQRTLAVFRPEFPASTGTSRGPGAPALRSTPREGGSLRTGFHEGSRAPVAASGAPSVLPERKPPSVRSSAPAGSSLSTPSPIGTPRPDASFTHSSSSRTLPAPNSAAPSRNPDPKPAPPLSSSPGDRPLRNVPASSGSTVSREAPRPAATFSGRNESRPTTPVIPPASSLNQAVRSLAVPSQRDPLPHSATTPRTPRVTTSSGSTSARTIPPPSALRSGDSPARSTPSRSGTVPSSPTPAPTRPSTPTVTAPRSTPAPPPAIVRSAPAPSFTPAPARPASPPATPFTARTPSMESRPTRSTPAPTFTPQMSRPASPPAAASVSRAPATVSRPTQSAPAQTFTPQPARSFSPPPTSSGQRAPAVQSQPSRPASSSSSWQSPSSSARRGR